MSTRNSALVAVLIAVLAVGCGSTEQPSAGEPNTTTTNPAPTSPTTETPDKAPGVRVADELRFTAKTVDGRDFDGASLAGRPAVLWFWAPWCPKCRAEADEIAGIARDHADKVTFVGVAAQDQVPAMQEFVRQYGVDFTHIADTDAAVWRRFGVTVQPAYAFVDSRGKVDVVKSQLGRDELTAKVAALS